MSERLTPKPANDRGSNRYQRYQLPEICDHLAAQYVAGHLTPRVRRRMEQLILITPALKQAVADWSEQLAPMHFQLEESTVPDQIWNGIQNRLFEKETAQESTSALERLLAFWRRLGVSTALASVALAAVLIWQTGTPEPWKVRGADYLAPMQIVTAAATSPNTSAGGSENVAFVISGYQGQNPGESFIALQWSEGAIHPDQSALHLWAENREDRSLTYLGPLPEAGKPWSMNKPQWAALINSGRLLVNNDPDQLQLAQALFQGPCLQLKQWKQS